MRITIMFNVRNIAIPKTVIRGSFYTLVSRSSIFGFHKITRDKNRDPLCSKTNLLMFVYENDANDIAKLIEMSQGKILRFQRDIDFSNGDTAVLDNTDELSSIDYRTADSIKPIHVETIPYNHMERMCLINHFDMLIVFKKHIRTKDLETYDVSLDCYEYITKEAPNRNIQEKIFRDMLFYYPDED